MKSIYIGIIILLGETECFIEDTTSIKIAKEQRTLLRKLQNFQDPTHEKPLTWNEILADVLVNRIKIFSFNEANENEIIKEDSQPLKSTRSENIVATCFSKVLLFYKNCIYDKWVKKLEDPEFPFDPSTTEGKTVLKHTDEFDDPKDDVEIIEPRYHGKQVDGESYEDEDVVKVECPEGAVKDEKGNCVNVHSKLIISVPGQCPRGYKLDRLGNCRMVFF